MSPGQPIHHKADLPARSEADQQAFFSDVMERTMLAETRLGIVRRMIEVAGMRIRLDFVGEKLAAKLMPALQHLEVTPNGHSEAHFHVWDSASAGVPMVPPPFGRDCFTDRGDIWGFSSSRYRSAFHWGEFAVNLMDMASGDAVCWFDTADQLPFWTVASPFRTLFHWLMAGHGAHLLHAACVGTEAAGMLITGKGGVGKSTTALACLDAGMFYISDDYLVLRLDPEPQAFSLYCTAKLNAEQTERFPQLRSLLPQSEVSEGDKAVFYLHPEHAHQLARAMPLHLHVTPRFVRGAESQLGPIAPTKLHAAAAFTTMAQLPHAGHATNSFIARLVTELPGQELRLGHDIARIPDVVRRGLSASSAPMPGPVADSPKPLVTAVIPVRNGARFLPDAVASIVYQDYQSLEIIIVDDGSHDEIEAAVANLPVDVRFFRQQHEGPSAARNRGIRDASGDVIAFLDVDDLWNANMLGPLVDLLLSEPDILVAKGCSQLIRLDDNGAQHYLGSAAEAFPYHIGSAVYRRSVFAKVGLFDEDLMFGEDTDWFNRLHESGLRMSKTDQVTLLVRRHDANMTRGKSIVEVNALRTFKKALDRRRAVAPHGTK
jgi:hypothetical protein